MRGAQPARLAPRLTQGAGRSPASRRVLPAVVVLRTATKSGRGDAVSLCCLSVRSPRTSAGTAQPHVESPVHRRSARNTTPSGRQAAQRLKVPARPGPSADLVSRGRDTPRSPGTQLSKVVAHLGTPPSRPGPKHSCCARSCMPGVPIDVDQGRAPAMVTLITEKLQNQSLDDLTRRAREAGPYSAEKLNKSGHLFPLEIGVDKSPWKALHGGWPIGSQVASGPFPLGPLGVSHNEGLKWQLASPGPMDVGSFLDLRESTGPPAAPPTKRHCRSLSEPEELARCRSPWRPGSSKVWTPISKRRCNSGGSATLQCCSALGSPALQGRSGLPRSSVSPPTPRPASASSGFVDGSEGSASSGPPWLSAGPCPFSSRRRLSLSQEHLVDANTCLPSASSTPTSTPELGRHHGLLRCRSQPCVLDGRRVRRKRRREEDARWTRPSLDFLKMTRTLKNSKSLCSLDYEDDEDDTQAKTVVSSPCNSQGLVGIITPGSSPRIPRPGPTSPSAWASGEPEASTGEGGSSGEPSDWDSAGEEGVFPLDHNDLDLEQIENN